MNTVLIAIIGTFGATLLSFPLIKWLMGAFNLDDELMTFKQNVIWFAVGVAFMAYFIIFEI